MFEIIDQIIVKYISENRRIIVPQLGAFMRKESGEIVFVEFLKKSDGVIQTLLRNNTTLNEAQANIVIEEFVAKVNSDIELQGSYIIEGLGTIFRGKDGIRELSYDPEIKAVGVVATPIMEERVADGEPPKATPDSHKIIADQSAPETIGDRLARETHYKEVPREDAPVEKPIMRAPERVVREKSPEIDSRRVQNTPRRAPRPQPQQRPTRTPMPKKKRADLVMIIAIAAALLAIGAMIFGLWSDNDPLTKIQPTAPTEQVEQAEQAEGVTEPSGAEVN